MFAGRAYFYQMDPYEITVRVGLPEHKLDLDIDFESIAILTKPAKRCTIRLEIPYIHLKKTECARERRRLVKQFTF